MEDKQKENIKLNSNFDHMSCVGWLLVFASVSYACTLLFTKRTDSHHIDFNSTTYTLLSFNCIRLSGDQRLLVHLSKATQGPYGRRSMLVIILPLVHTTKPTAVPWWRGEWGKLVGVAMHDHTEHLSTHTKKKIEIEKIRNSVLYQWKRCTCSDIPISLADLLVIWIVKYTTRRTRKVIKAELTKLEKKKKTRIEEKYSPPDVRMAQEYGSVHRTYLYLHYSFRCEFHTTTPRSDVTYHSHLGTMDWCILQCNAGKEEKKVNIGYNKLENLSLYYTIV